MISVSVSDGPQSSSQMISETATGTLLRVLVHNKHSTWSLLLLSLYPCNFWAPYALLRKLCPLSLTCRAPGDGALVLLRRQCSDHTLSIQVVHIQVTQVVALGLETQAVGKRKI